MLPHDLQLERLPWSAVVDAEPPVNPELRDVIDVYYPVQHELIGRLRAGRSAAWLGDVGLGLPGSSFIGWGVWSPFNLPALALPFPLAWSWATALRLFAAMAGAHLLARSFGAGRFGGTVAGIAFGLCGFVIGWLGWPQSHVAAFLPWVLWAVRRTAGREPAWWGVPAVALGTAGLWLGGFPSVAVYGLLAAGALAVGAAAGRRDEGWRGPAFALTAALAGVLLGTALAAFTLLPSLAFLGVADLSGRATRYRANLPLEALALFLVPSAYGDVVRAPFTLSGAYVESIGYVGVVPLLLAPVAWFVRPRAGTGGPRLGDVALLTALAAAALAIVVGAEPIPALLARLPLLRMNAPTRFLAVAAVLLAVLGGLGADALVRCACREARVPWPAAAALAGLVAALAVVAVDVRPVALLLASARDLAPADGEAQAVRTAAAAVVRAGALTATAAALAVLALVAGRWTRRRAGAALGSGLVVLTAVDLLLFASGWNVQVPARDLFPDAPGLAELAELSERHRVAGTDGVGQPNTSLEHDIADVRAHAFLTPRQDEILDRMRVRRFSATRWDLDPRDSGAWAPWLSVLGVAAVLAPDTVGALPDLVPVGPPPQVPLGAVTAYADDPLVARVIVPESGVLRGVGVRIGTFDRRNRGALEVRVSRSDGERRTGRLALAGLADNSTGVVRIPPVEVARGDVLRVAVGATTLSADVAVTVWGVEGPYAYTPDRPALALLIGDPYPVTDLGPVRLFRNPDAPELVSASTEARWVAPGLAPVAIEAAGREAVGRRVWLDAPPAPRPRLPDGGRALLNGWDRGHGWALARVVSTDGAVVVARDLALPGWQARVDGQEVALHVADHVFLGVVVPPGVHTVSFRYTPPWRDTGIGVSAGALLAVLAVALMARRRSRS